MGDVLQSAGEALRERLAAFRLANRTRPERVAVAATTLQFEVEVIAIDEGVFDRGVQALAIGFDHAGLHCIHRCRRDCVAKNADRFVAQIQSISPGIPLPAADVSHGLDAIEQRAVALEFGDVAEQRQHLMRPVGAGSELWHRCHRQPGQLTQAQIMETEYGALGDLARVQGAKGGQLIFLQRVAVLVDHLPTTWVQFVIQGQAFFDIEQPDCGGVGVDDAIVGVTDDDAFVDDRHQLAVMQLDLGAFAEVACDGQDAGLAVVIKVGRMHLDRIARAISAHVGDFDDAGFPPFELAAQRTEVIPGQVGIQHFDRLADDLLARALVGGDAGLVEVKDGPIPTEDADRIGDCVEQRVVTLPRALGPDGGGMQRIAGLFQQRAHRDRKCGIIAGRLQPSEGLRDVHVDGLRTGRWRKRLGVHDAASARPTLLPLSRPSSAASQRPVSASAARSMPVSMPSPCSM